MKKILNITLAAAFACAMTGCQDFLDTSSPSVVDRDFVFSNEESARGALYYGYETLRANRSVHNVGFFWHPVWGSDIEDSQDIYDEGSAGICEKYSRCLWLCQDTAKSLQFDQKAANFHAYFPACVHFA